MMIEMPRLQAAPLATRDLAEHRRRPVAVLDLSGDEAIDEIEALLSLGLEIARDIGRVLGRRGSAVRPWHAVEHELQNRNGKRGTPWNHLDVAERGLEHLIAVPEHLARRHAAPSAGRGGRQGLDPGADRITDGLIVEMDHGVPLLEKIAMSLVFVVT